MRIKSKNRGGFIRLQPKGVGVREGIVEKNGKKNKETSVYRLCPRLNTKKLCLANGLPNSLAYDS